MSSCTRLVTGSLYSDLKICQKQLIGGRNGQNYGTLKWAHRSNQSVFGMWNIWETTGNWENEAISSGLVTRRLYFFKKKRTLNGRFSRPAETDPYVNVKAWGSLLVLEAVKSTRIPVYTFKTLCFQLLTLPCNANLFRKSDRQKLKNRQTALSSPDSPSLADSFKNPWNL